MVAHGRISSQRISLRREKRRSTHRLILSSPCRCATIPRPLCLDRTLRPNLNRLLPGIRMMSETVEGRARSDEGQGASVRPQADPHQKGGQHPVGPHLRAAERRRSQDRHAPRLQAAPQARRQGRGRDRLNHHAEPQGSRLGCAAEPWSIQDFVNRDDKEANDSRDSEPSTTVGMKKGGRPGAIWAVRSLAHQQLRSVGLLQLSSGRHWRRPEEGRPAPDEAEDKKLIRREVKTFAQGPP